MANCVNLMTLFEELQGLMVKYRFRPEKKLSQFFCVNEALLQYLVNEGKLSPKDTVLEIGPGIGFLTRKLLDTSCKVVAIEKDETLYEALGQEFAKEIKSGKLKLICADALEENFDKLGITKVVSLPPYHISSELVSKITFSKAKRAVMVFDKGFVEKLSAFEGFTEYGYLTAFVNLNAKVEVKESIEASSFFPAPNCVSSVVTFDFAAKNNSKEYFAFLKELFRHKNKDLQRALKQAAPFLQKTLEWKENIEVKFDKLKFANKKVYAMSPQELLKAYTILTSKK